METEEWLNTCERMAVEARKLEENARKQAEDWERRAYVERQCQRALARYEAYYRILDALLAGQEKEHPEVPMEPFASWSDLIAYLDAHSNIVYYKAPLDHRPVPVVVAKRFRNGKLRCKHQDVTFTADEGHLNRFFKPA